MDPCVHINVTPPYGHSAWVAQCLVESISQHLLLHNGCFKLVLNSFGHTVIWIIKVWQGKKKTWNFRKLHKPRFCMIIELLGGGVSTVKLRQATDMKETEDGMGYQMEMWTRCDVSWLFLHIQKGYFCFVARGLCRTDFGGYWMDQYFVQESKKMGFFFEVE